MKRRKNGSPWTVARLAALLGRLKHNPTLTELKDKYGIGLKELAVLNKGTLGTVGETETGRETCLAIQFGENVAFSMAGPVLEKAASLSKTELYLAVMGLRRIVAGPDARKDLLDLANRLEREGGPLKDAHREVFFGPLMNNKSVAVLLAVMDAVNGSRILRFKYKANYDGSLRIVRPLSLRKDAGEWRLLAWDEDKNALRVFKLIHMSEPQVLAENFTWPKEVDRDDALARDLSVYRPSGMEIGVSIKIRADALRHLQHLFPHHRAPKTGNAWMKVELLSTDAQWVARTLLPELPDVKVVSPPEFVKALKGEYLAVCGMYR